VRLHFWLLFFFFIRFIQTINGGSYLWFFVGVGVALVALILHECGHRFAAMHYGGRHDDFVLWPLGGMIPAASPPYPLPTFIVHAAGMMVNLATFALCSLLLLVLQHRLSAAALNPLQFLNGRGGSAATILGSSLVMVVQMLGSFSFGLVLVNLLPFYVLDGGYLLQAILWPWTGLYRAINVTCIVGMVIATLFFLLALLSFSIFGMLWWGFLFSNSFLRRRQLQMTGTGEFDDAIAHSAQWRGDDPAPRSRPTRARVSSAAKRAAADRALEARIDQILDKVREHGMQSLTFFEKRTLKQATERERRRTGAPRR
jgi:Zn-dependent protease